MTSSKKCSENTPIPNKVFSYGTLQLESVQKEVFSRALSYKKFTLSGYKTTDVSITDPRVIALSGQSIHKGLVFTGCTTDRIGGVLLNITPEDLLPMDAYEVSDYKRISLTQDGQTFWVYVL